MSVHRLDIDPVKQPVKLLYCQAHDCFLPWPGETVLFKPFHEKPKSVALPQQQLDAVAPTIGEDDLLRIV